VFGPKSDLERLKKWDWDKVSESPEWRAEQLAFHYFFNVLMCTTDQNGWTMTGCHFSQRGLNTLLVVKAEHEGTPLVAFQTEQFPTGCVRSFCRRYLDQRVEWRKDKFAKT